MSPLRLLWIAAFTLLLPLEAAAQDRLLSPAEFLGYELGTRFTRHHQVVDYVEHVGAASPNVQVAPYGTTPEGRTLLLAFVTRPDRLDRLDAVREDNLRLARLAEGDPAPDAPAVVWLSYNVHGNEAVNTESAMQTLYELADPTNARTQAWLEDTVVIIDPCLNPDGRDRYVNWYNQTVGRFPNVLPEAREHAEPWPGGRSNHYYFDLNRDWAWMTQVETQQRLAVFNAWLPHVHADFHEQGVNAPYYFAPAARPFHESITAWQREFQTTIGLNHTRYFDANGWLYFTRQVFDLFYPGYGDTWPTYNGAIGMTYEQGGSGRAGLGIITAEGDTLTLAERILHHHVTGLSTVEVTAQNARRVVDEFQQFYARDPQGPYASYVVKQSNGADPLRTLAAHLDGQGIAYGYATQARTGRGFSYRQGGEASMQVEVGDLVIPADQPKSNLVHVLFEPTSALEDSLSYDITAWALPYVYNVEAYATDQVLDTSAEAPAVSAGVMGEADRPYAYLAEWQSFEDAQLLADALQRGLKPRFATRPFEIDGRAYAPGTLILTRAGHEGMASAFDATVRELAEAHGQPLQAVSTGFVDTGSDFGSNDVIFLERPHVAVLAGESVSSGAAGEVWHYFDQQLGYPVTLLYTDGFRVSDLDDYDVLVLPSGFYGSILTSEVLSDLRGWIRAGGRVVAMERAAHFLGSRDGFDLTRKTSDALPDTTETPGLYADRQRDSISDDVTGAIVRVQLDATHPLAYGYGDTYYSLKRGDDAFALLDDEWNVGRLGEDPLVSGFAGYRAQAKLDDTLAFGVQDLGRGAVVYLLDGPLFRGFWYGGRLLFANAVFMVGQD
ncbi:MAG: M14 family metallopeptidase [Bacteroidota bacterium]